MSALKARFEATVKKSGVKNPDVMVLGAFVHVSNLGQLQAERLQKMFAASGYKTQCFESKVTESRNPWKVVAKAY